MKETKKLAISAMLVALGVALTSVGAALEVADLTACAIASLFVVLVYIEIGSPYTWLVWLATSALSAILFFGSPVWSEYLLVFGIYPIIKAYIERLPKGFWWPIKLLYINVVIWVLFLFVEGLLGVAVFEAEGAVMKAVLYAVINVAFVVYDLFITTMVRVYIFKWRKRFARFFK